MSKNGYGRIVLTSSSASMGDPSSFIYSSAKSAIIGMVKSLKYDGRRCGISVNGIMPGAVTAMNPAYGLKTGPEHVTPATLFLCHERCPDNGEMVYAEGGMY